MSAMHWLALAIAFTGVLISASIVYFAQHSTNISVTPSITVQAPQAVLPEALMDTLRSVNDRLAPERPLMDVEQVKVLIDEGISLAEVTKGLKGPEKFKAAKNFVLDVAKGRGLTVDDRAIALSIEAAVVQRGLVKK